MAFFGEYQVSVTSGGRIVLPKKIRENLKGELFVLTKGFDVCLAGYDKDDWGKRSRELMNVSLLDREHIEKRRYIFSAENDIEIDEQGRFVVPKALVAFIGLNDKTVTIIGVGDHFEIWETKKWKMYIDKIRV